MSVSTVVPEEQVSRREQILSWLTPLNLHLLGAVLLALVTLYLTVHALVLWSRGGNAGEEAISAARSGKLAAEMSARPLRGLDGKLKLASEQADKFYKTRLPYAYSDVAEELGVLKKQYNVRLSRVQYLQSASANGLSEVRMDAQVTGDYSSLAHFLNALERDHSFFVISALGLSGQQTGQVNLRIQMRTYLREPMPANTTALSGGTQ